MGKELHTDEEIAAAARTLQEKGARNVLVSMAGDGALLLDEQYALGEGKTEPGRDGSVAGGGRFESGSYESEPNLWISCRFGLYLSLIHILPER